MSFKPAASAFWSRPPPNASSVYTDDLPRRAQNAGRPTEYDLLMSTLAAKGVPAVDLRPVLKKARPGGSLFYMHDTHWSFRGALMAYNAIVEADSHPDWRSDPNSAWRRPCAKLRHGEDPRSLR
jgi:SGNH hydrolase-like domain, acetyltransferase AlgX